MEFLNHPFTSVSSIDSLRSFPLSRYPINLTPLISSYRVFCEFRCLDLIRDVNLRNALMVGKTTGRSFWKRKGKWGEFTTATWILTLDNISSIMNKRFEQVLSLINMNKYLKSYCKKGTQFFKLSYFFGKNYFVEQDLVEVHQSEVKKVVSTKDLINSTQRNKTNEIFLSSQIRPKLLAQNQVHADIWPMLWEKNF